MRIPKTLKAHRVQVVLTLIIVPGYEGPERTLTEQELKNYAWAHIVPMQPNYWTEVIDIRSMTPAPEHNTTYDMCFEDSASDHNPRCRGGN